MYRSILALSYYSSCVRPIAIYSTVNGLYIGGNINAVDDIINGRKKPIYVNLFQMVKYATAGALFGIMFPITTPAILIYAAMQK
jgi:hypothetical protein